jgi:hypothetical protein
VATVAKPCRQVGQLLNEPSGHIQANRGGGLGQEYRGTAAAAAIGPFVCRQVKDSADEAYT